MDSNTFLVNLRRSGLVSTQELDAALDRVPAAEAGKAVARGLVQLGLLTRFQAELLLAGRTNGFVLGQYRILDQLGQGGMGRVFKAEHRSMGRQVAIKVLAPQHTKTERARQLFMREVRAAGKLMHPNIVTAHDANELDGRHYLVMEFIDGPNLDRLVRDRGPLPVGLACDIVRQAGAGLQCAFERGMVHRDIKPSNMILQRTGTTLSSGYLVKILDFGLAHLGDTAEESDGSINPGINVLIGTPDYVSPEQSRGIHLVDIRSDLYSLGCTFYFLLSGQVPFPGGTTHEKLHRHNREEPVPVEKLRPDIPSQVADLVQSLMAKNPAHRYQTPAELVMELTPLAMPVPSAWPLAKTAVPPTAETVSPVGSTSFAPDDKPTADPDSALSALLHGGVSTLSAGDVSLLPVPQRRDLTAMAWCAAGGGLVGAMATAAGFLLLR